MQFANYSITISKNVLRILTPRIFIMKMIKYKLLPILLISFVLNTFAHEYWFEPEKFILSPNEKTAIHLYVGDGLIKDREETPYQQKKTFKFQLFSQDETKDLITSITDGATPIFNFSAEKSGNYLLAMERNWSYIELGAKEFEDYLQEDGMEYIIAERKKSGDSRKPGKERYSRFIKSLLQVGDKYDSTYKKKLGMKLEIIPLENPYRKKIGEDITFRVLFNGKPLANKTVFASNRNNSKQKIKTDKSGKFSFSLNREGLWLVHLVYMQRCYKDCNKADWESFWGAFSFGI